MYSTHSFFPNNNKKSHMFPEYCYIFRIHFSAYYFLQYGSLRRLEKFIFVCILIMIRKHKRILWARKIAQKIYCMWVKIALYLRFDLVTLHEFSWGSSRFIVKCKWMSEIVEKNRISEKVKFLQWMFHRIRRCCFEIILNSVCELQLTTWHLKVSSLILKTELGTTLFYCARYFSIRTMKFESGQESV